MKNNFKINSIFIGVCLLALACIAGCDKYERKGVVNPEITINTHSLDLFVGETAQLKAGPSELSFNWTSDDPAVASVDGSGLVTAVGEGNTNIVVSSGKMTTSIPVASVKKIPLKGFTLSEENVDISRNGRKMIVPILDPPNANDASAPVWRSLVNEIATVDYKGDITGWSLGKTEVICTINGMEQKVGVNVVFALTKPFKGPHVLSKDEPLFLKFIDFDLGGEGVAYHDNDASNNGGNNYRAANGDFDGGGVDIGSDLAIGWTSGGEWLFYTIEVHDAGDYYLSLDLAGDGTSNVRFEVDGVNMTGTINIQRTGGWGTWLWQHVEKPITLAEGEYKMRFYLQDAGSNFRTMKFSTKSPTKTFAEMLSGVSGKNWKIGAWTSMRNPDNRNEVWWDFKDPSIMNDVFTFKPDDSFVHDNQGDSFMNESLGNLIPGGDPNGSFVTTNYTPPADAKFEVSLSSDGRKFYVTLKKAFLGYAVSPNDLTSVNYEIASYSDTSIRLYHPDWNGWCFEIVPAD